MDFRGKLNLEVIGRNATYSAEGLLPKSANNVLAIVVKYGKQTVPFLSSLIVFYFSNDGQVPEGLKSSYLRC